MKKSTVVVIAFFPVLSAILAMGQTTNPAVGANTAFAVDLYHWLSAEPAAENIFYSPWSVTSVMSMVAEGSQRNTLMQMMRALHFGDASLHPIHEGISALNPLFNTSDGYQLSNVNAEIPS